LSKKSRKNQNIDYSVLAKQVSKALGREIKRVTCYRIHKGYQQGRAIEQAIENVLQGDACQ